jgi:peptidoglycan/xylan/chitin deacetylase (PgdA/CDA1 family)
VKKYIKHNIKKLIMRHKTFHWFFMNATQSLPRILMYHRFSNSSERINHLTDKDTFEWQVSAIKKRWKVLPLSSFADAIIGGKRLKRCAVITIDDGYRDFYENALPILKKNQIPATFFVTVNFVDRKIWLWHDIIKYMLQNSKTKISELVLNGFHSTLNLQGEDVLQETWQRLSDYCVDHTDDKKWALIDKLSSATGVSLPDQPTREYDAATWDHIKEMAEVGIEIGSHTMNHPILSQIDTRDILLEISESKRRIEERLEQPIQSFCYPNGRKKDITSEVVDAVKSAGYKCAVLGPQRDFGSYANIDHFRIPRIGLKKDKDDFLWKMIGGEFILNWYSNRVSK